MRCGVELHHLEVAQALEAVAAQVGVVLHRGVAELRASLDVEEEQQAVHEAQAFERELRCDVGAEDLVLAHVAQVVDGLVAEELDRLAQRVLEVLRHAEGVLVRALVEGVEDRRTVGRAGALAVQQRRRGAQGVVVAAAEELDEVEAQEALLGPFGAVEEQHLRLADEQHEARRLACAERLSRQQVLEVRVEELRVRVVPAVGVELLGQQRQLQRVRLLAGRGPHDGDAPQQRRAVRAADGAQRRKEAAVDGVQLRRRLVAERIDELGAEGAVPLDAGRHVALAFEQRLELEEVLVEPAQVRPRLADIVLAVVRLPAVEDRRLEVPRHDRGEVVVSVELVGVFDPYVHKRCCCGPC